MALTMTTSKCDCSSIFLAAPGEILHWLIAPHTHHVNSSVFGASSFAMPSSRSTQPLGSIPACASWTEKRHLCSQGSRRAPSRQVLRRKKNCTECRPRNSGAAVRSLTSRAKHVIQIHQATKIVAKNGAPSRRSLACRHWAICSWNLHCNDQMST